MPKKPPDKQQTPRTIRTQWLILGLGLLTLSGATAFSLYVERTRTAVREEARLLTQVNVLQQNIDRNMDEVNRVLLHLRKESWHNRPGPDLDEHLRLLADAMPGVRTLLVLDSEGKVVAASRPELLGGKFAYREYFQTPRQNPDPDRLFVAAPITTSLGAYGITVARTLPGAHQQFGGLAVATLDPEYFRTLMNSVLYAPDMWTAIAHGDGIQFLMVPERDDQIGKNLAQPGSFFTRHRDSGKNVNVMTGTVYATGEERMMALRSILPATLHQDKALVVAAGRDLGAIYAAWRYDLLVQSGLLGLFALTAVLGLYAFQRREREYARKEAAAAAAIATNERFLRALTDNIPGMVAYWTRELRCRFANQAYLEWFGRSPEQMRDIRIQDLLGEELFARNEPFIRGALRGERQRFERTLTKADGSIGHTWAHYIPDLDGEEVRGFFVLVADISELKQTEMALAESELQLKTIIETEPECVKVLAPDGTLLQMNPAGLAMIEADSASQVIGHKVSDIVAPAYREAFEALNQRVGQGESGSLEFEVIGLKGGHRWLDTHAVPMRDAAGQITGVLGVTRDITDRKKAEQALEQLAQTDFLTQLANRRHFMTLAEQELARTLRYGGALSVLMMDVDHFKSINDTYGHQTGDTVLQQLAERCRQTLRDVDSIGRIGGEEFAVVLPQADGAQALEVAERIRQSISEDAVVLEQGLPLHFSVSIGVATLGDTRINLDTLLSHADQALYRAKNTGRNKVFVYDRLTDGVSCQQVT